LSTNISAKPFDFLQQERGRKESRKEGKLRKKYSSTFQNFQNFQNFRFAPSTKWQVVGVLASPPPFMSLPSHTIARAAFGVEVFSS
jgi:hypothetical protein